MVLDLSTTTSFFPYLITSNAVKILSISSDNTSKPPEVQLPKILIADGKINKNSLNSINKDKDWIMAVLQKHNITHPKEVFIAMYDTKGQFQYQLYDDYERMCKK